MNRYLTATALLGALALTGSGLANAQPPASPAPPPAKTETRCFYSTQWNGWTAPDAHTMYIRVDVNRVFRLDFKNECSEMTEPDVHLITHIHGPDTICSPLDIDLKVAESSPGSIAVPCIVSGMTELTPDEVKALPKKSVP